MNTSLRLIKGKTSVDDEHEVFEPLEEEEEEEEEEDEDAEADLTAADPATLGALEAAFVRSIETWVEAEEEAFGVRMDAREDLFETATEALEDEFEAEQEARENAFEEEMAALEAQIEAAIATSSTVATGLTCFQAAPGSTGFLADAGMTASTTISATISSLAGRARMS